MEVYIDKVFLKYGHIKSTHPQLTPHKNREIKYGAKQQLRPAEDTSPALYTKGIRRIQEIIGSLLYYSWDVDNKLLVALSHIGSQQAAATKDTATAIRKLLDYVATYPNDGIIYRSRNTVLTSHADASFRNESRGRIRAGAHIF